MGMRGNIILERVNAGCRSHTSPALPTASPPVLPGPPHRCGITVGHQAAVPCASPPVLPLPPSASHGSVRARLFLERLNLVTLLTKEGVNADRHANA